MKVESSLVIGAHFILDEQINWHEIGKCYANKSDFEREFEALKCCKGLYIQELVRANKGEQRLYFKYYDNAKSLDRLDITQIDLFVCVLPAVVRAIAHCHSNGWVHGDIKPANILYFPETGSIRLIDFGASFPSKTSRIELEVWQFSQQYAPRNQRKGIGCVEERDDWFALLVMVDQVISQILDKKLQKRASYIRSSIKRLFHPALSNEMNSNNDNK